MLQVTLKCARATCDETIEAPLEVADGIPAAWVAHMAASHVAMSRDDAAVFADKWATVVAFLTAHQEERRALGGGVA